MEVRRENPCVTNGRDGPSPCHFAKTGPSLQAWDPSRVPLCNFMNSIVRLLTLTYLAVPHLSLPLYVSPTLHHMQPSHAHGCFGQIGRRHARVEVECSR
jgi:hypothetical protein